MNWSEVIFGVIGGFSMFVYGMTIMSESLQRIAGDRMKSILGAMSTNRVFACLSGMGVTAIIQSSTATTVMLVGFVNAGLLTLTQGVGVALGAHIGTTLTAQLLAFNITGIALPAIGLGGLLKIFCSNRKLRDIGGLILGFGFLFFGLLIIKSGVTPLKDSPIMVHFFTSFDASTLKGILFCVLVGIISTMVIHSSAVTVGLTMTLAAQGLLTLPGAMALVLGDNIGTTITAELAAIRTDISARRMARANTISNIIGVTYMIILFPFYVKLVVWFTQAITTLGPPEEIVAGAKPNIARYIANAHTLFNVINAIVMVSILPFLVKIAVALTSKGKEAESSNLSMPVYLDEGSLKNPSVALSLSRKEIVRMAEISQSMAGEVFAAFVSRSRKELGSHENKEEALDSLQHAIHQYLVRLYNSKNSQEEQDLITAQMTMVNGIERLGDTTTNVANSIIYALDKNVYLSKEAMDEYNLISATALEFHELVTNALRENRNDILPQAMELENRLDDMRFNMREQHLARLRAGVCNVNQGLVFTDMLNYFERLGDYLLKISRAWVEQASTGL